jgi:phosphatidate cytidylyltransferase
MPLQTARFGDLRQRAISGVVLGLGAFALLWLGGLWAATLIAALAGAMAWEWRAMTRGPSTAALADSAPLLLACAGGVLVAHFTGFAYGFGWLGVMLLLAVGIDLWRRPGMSGWTLAGGVYLGTACIGFLALRSFEPFGFLSVVWIALVVAASDIGGYFAGRLVGGPKLWPAISPKKTWAGLAGGVGLAFLLGGVFSWATTGTYYQQVCAVSAVAALVAQAGDLAESAAKRHFGVKDSGTLIPGHGGALDRFDGLIAATLVAAAVTYGRGQTVFLW